MELCQKKQTAIIHIDTFNKVLLTQIKSAELVEVLESQEENLNPCHSGEATPTWQRGDELVDVVDVPLTRVAGQEGVGQQGQVRARTVSPRGGPRGGRQRGWRRLAAGQVRTLTGLAVRRVHGVASRRRCSRRRRFLHTGGENRRAFTAPLMFRGTKVCLNINLFCFYLKKLFPEGAS